MKKILLSIVTAVACHTARTLALGKNVRPRIAYNKTRGGHGEPSLAPNRCFIKEDLAFWKQNGRGGGENRREVGEAELGY